MIRQKSDLELVNHALGILERRLFAGLALDNGRKGELSNRPFFEHHSVRPRFSALSLHIETVRKSILKIDDAHGGLDTFDKEPYSAYGCSSDKYRYAKPHQHR